MRILIVDDEPEICRNIKDYLELEGLTDNYMAYSGIQALNIIKTEKIQFVISDIQMPNGDGLSMTKAIMKELKGSPPIILTSGFNEYSHDEIMKTGAITLMKKPIDLRRLIKIIRSYEKNCA